MNKKEFKKHYNKVMYFAQFDDPKHSDVTVVLTGKELLEKYDANKDDPMYIKVIRALMTLTQDQLNFYNFDFDKGMVKLVPEEEYWIRQINDLFRK